MSKTFKELRSTAKCAQIAWDNADGKAISVQRGAMEAYDELNRFVPVTKGDLRRKLRYTRRQVEAIGGSTDEWPGLPRCIRSLRKAEKGIVERRAKSLKHLDRAWRELRDRFGDDHPDTIAAASVVLGFNWIGAQANGAAGEVTIG